MSGKARRARDGLESTWREMWSANWALGVGHKSEVGHTTEGQWLGSGWIRCMAYQGN